jgi:hypothetical protein
MPFVMNLICLSLSLSLRALSLPVSFSDRRTFTTCAYSVPRAHNKYVLQVYSYVFIGGHRRSEYVSPRHFDPSTHL